MDGGARSPDEVGNGFDSFEFVAVDAGGDDHHRSVFCTGDGQQRQAPVAAVGARSHLQLAALPLGAWQCRGLELTEDHCTLLGYCVVGQGADKRFAVTRPVKVGLGTRQQLRIDQELEAGQGHGLGGKDHTFGADAGAGRNYGLPAVARCAQRPTAGLYLAGGRDPTDIAHLGGSATLRRRVRVWQYLTPQGIVNGLGRYGAKD